MSDCRCLCCQKGERCAYLLLLSPKDAARERWLFAVMGMNPDEPPRQIAKRPPNIEKFKREPDEPTAGGNCAECGSPMSIAVYLAEFLATYGAKWPECGECETKARAA